jgi:hypothetical protein
LTINIRERLIVLRIAFAVGADEAAFLRLVGADPIEAGLANWVTTHETVAMLLAPDKPAVHLPLRHITGKGPTTGE